MADLGKEPDARMPSVHGLGKAPLCLYDRIVGKGHLIGVGPALGVYEGMLRLYEGEAGIGSKCLIVCNRLLPGHAPLRALCCHGRYGQPAFELDPSGVKRLIDPHRSLLSLLF